MRYKVMIGVLAALALTVICTQSMQAQIVEGFETFTGTGFAPSPSAGQLDSDDWIVTGLSDGDLNFGDTGDTGDFARGTSNGGSSTGGVYAFSTGSNTILGVQPIGSDFTPGTFVYRWTNNTGEVVTALDIGYDIWHYNDQGRANSLNFAYAADCTTYTAVPSLDFTTPEAADASPAWASANRTTSVLSLNIADGGTFCLQWTGDDASGSGSRDEYGIDDISVTPTTSTLVELASFVARADGDVVVLEWETATEIDNAGFNVYRRTAEAGEFSKLNTLLIAAQAEPGEGALYRLEDRPGDGRFEYLLEDVDVSGRATRHGPAQVAVGGASVEMRQRVLLPIIIGP